MSRGLAGATKEVGRKIGCRSPRAGGFYDRNPILRAMKGKSQGDFVADANGEVTR